jgi:heme/copper-type cytochrome/quinol oxidase subunit 3
LKIIPTAAYFNLDTDLEKADVEKRLREKVRTRSVGNFFALSSSLLIGDVYWSGFEFKKNVVYNYGCNPVFHGVFERRDTGVRVKVNASSFLATLNAVVLWVASLATLVWAFVNLFNGDYDSARILALVGLLMGVADYISVRIYYHTIHDVHEELLALLNTKTAGK